MTDFNPNQDQIRTYECRATADASRREVAGVGVPLEVETVIWPGFREVFDQECIFDGIERTKLKTHHRTLIGVIASTSREAGKLNIVGRASKTRDGDEALALAEDGALDSFSIGFRSIEYTRTDHEDGSFTIRHTRVAAREFSLTDNPAYTDATVNDVREAKSTPTKEPIMTITREELTEALAPLAEVQEQVRATQAQVATLGDHRRENATPRFQSFGEFVRAYHAGDSEARSMQTAYLEAASGHSLHNQRADAGSVLADTIARDPWVGDAIRLIDKGRKVLNSFQTAPLPAEGTRLEYGVLTSNTVKVRKQAAEGDLLGKGKVVVDTDSTPVGTFGGWSELSFQSIERGSLSLLNLTRRAQLIAYAQQTEAEVRALLASTMTDNITNGHNLDMLATPDAKDWISLMIDAYDAFEDAALPVDGLYLSKDKFKELATLEDGNGRLQFEVFGQGANAVGKLNIDGLTAQAGPTTVRILPGAAPKSGAFYSDQAITTWENAGAPVALEDSNITNLTRSYSVYGYLATAAEIPEAILPIEFAV